jgi:hypothetical protein
MRVAVSGYGFGPKRSFRFGTHFVSVRTGILASETTQPISDFGSVRIGLKKATHSYTRVYNDFRAEKLLRKSFINVNYDRKRCSYYILIHSIQVYYCLFVFEKFETLMATK